MFSLKAPIPKQTTLYFSFCIAISVRSIYILLQSLLNYIPPTYIILFTLKNTNITLCIQSLEAMCKCFLLSERKRRYSTPSLSSTYNVYRAFHKYTKLPFCIVYAMKSKIISVIRYLQ